MSESPDRTNDPDIGEVVWARCSLRWAKAEVVSYIVSTSDEDIAIRFLDDSEAHRYYRAARDLKRECIVDRIGRLA